MPNTVPIGTIPETPYPSTDEFAQIAPFAEELAEVGEEEVPLIHTSTFLEEMLIDEFASAAIALNAKANNVTLDITQDDMIGREDAWDIILVGDMCYERPLAERLLAWLIARKQNGCIDWMAVHSGQAAWSGRRKNLNPRRAPGVSQGGKGGRFFVRAEF